MDSDPTRAQGQVNRRASENVEASRCDARHLEAAEAAIGGQCSSREWPQRERCSGGRRKQGEKQRLCWSPRIMAQLPAREWRTRCFSADQRWAAMRDHDAWQQLGAAVIERCSRGVAARGGEGDAALSSSSDQSMLPRANPAVMPIVHASVAAERDEKRAQAEDAALSCRGLSPTAATGAIEPALFVAFDPMHRGDEAASGLRFQRGASRREERGRWAAATAISRGTSGARGRRRQQRGRRGRTDTTGTEKQTNTDTRGRGECGVCCNDRRGRALLCTVLFCAVDRTVMSLLAPHSASSALVDRGVLLSPRCSCCASPLLLCCPLLLLIDRSLLPRVVLHTKGEDDSSATMVTAM